MSDSVQNPFETPRPRGIRLMQGALRVCVAMQCFGMAAARLHLQQSDLFCELLGQGRELPADQIANLSNIVAYALIVGGVLTLLRPTTLILLPLIVYLAGTAAAATLVPDAAWGAWQPALQATRIATPLALMLVDFWPPRIKPTLVMCLSATALLRLATVVTLVAQGVIGIEESRHSGPILELFQKALQRGMNSTFTTDQAATTLALVSATGIGLAVALLTGRSRLIMALCTVFGLLTAFLDTLAEGSTGYAQSLAGISLAGAPLALLLFHLTSVREQPPIYRPETRSTPAAPPPAPGKKK